MAAFIDKLCPRAELAARVRDLARPIVFTNGVFDILHRGHVSYLAEARALGASLLVGERMKPMPPPKMRVCQT